MGDGIDPVEFGMLIATVKANTDAVKELSNKLGEHIDTTRASIDAINVRDAKRKHLIIGALGAGTFGGATLGEVLKQLVKTVWPPS